MDLPVDAVDPGASRSASPAGVTLLLGGARSGKSGLAVEIGLRSIRPITFVATAQAFDDDMAQRIARHRAERPGWTTVEEPTDLLEVLQAADPEHLVIVDCLTLWVSNLMLDEVDGPAIVELAAATAAVAAARPGPTVVVSNEVGLAVHPPTEMGRHYQDTLGRVNQRWAAVATRSLLLVAGRALRLDDPWEVLQ